MAAAAAEQGDGAGCTTLLLLGEGNFSFSLALARMLYPSHRQVKHDRARLRGETEDGEAPPGDARSASALHVVADDYLCGVLPPPPQESEWRPQESGDGDDGEATFSRVHVVATSFDSEPQLLDKYPECTAILRKLKSFANVTVLHEVNAWDLDATFGGRQFDYIIWNHPHLGVEDMRLHKFLLAHFLHSVRGHLKPDGLVNVSLVHGQAERWDLRNQAEKKGLHLLREAPFKTDLFQGYICKRNTYGGSFKNQPTQRRMQSDMFSSVYTFGSDAGRLLSVDDALDRMYSARDTASGDGDGDGDDESSPESDKPEAVAAETKDNSNELTCKFCGREFTSARAVYCHEHQVHVLKKYGEWDANPTRSLKCEHCNKKFREDRALAQHRIAVHSQNAVSSDEGGETHEEKPTTYVPCDVCGQAVPSHWQMGQHLESLKPLVGLGAECLLCKKRFIEQRALQQHLNFCSLAPEERAAVAAEPAEATTAE